MGNSSTKEQGPGRDGPRRAINDASRSNDTAIESSPLPSTQTVYSSRGGRHSRSDLSALLGMSHTSHDQDNPSLEIRKETKQEREARKLEKERVLRARERERSMRNEHVDGGYLVTQGVYTGIEDYNKGIVRQLMIERRLAPFWRGLHDHSDSWTENQLVAVARGRPLPAPDAIPQEEPATLSNIEGNAKMVPQSSLSVDSLTVPISSRAQSFNSDASSSQSPMSPNFPSMISESAPGSSSIGSALSRGRAKTIASLSGTSKAPGNDATPKEVNLPRDPSVSGLPIEAYLYKTVLECSICLLEYPPYLNKTRCCDQPICSECFVQIKRPDPHPPEHVHPAHPPLVSDGEVRGAEPDQDLVSEPAKCPYCNREEFGITYEPPPFRRGLAYASKLSTHPLKDKVTSAMSSSSSIASGHSIGERFSLMHASVPRRRTTSVSASDPSVIATDRVRPDWHYKLTAARAHTARRSAAATALHTAAYLMGNRGFEQDGRSFGAFGRRGILRRTAGPEGDPGAADMAHLNLLTLMSDRHTAQRGDRGEASTSHGPASGRGATPRLTSRRGRAEDLEEMMMMEAIRLSLASEEERRKREEKEAKKESKRRDKEIRKAEKEARKTSASPHHSGGSNLDVSNNEIANSGKAKAMDRGYLTDHASGSTMQSPSNRERVRQYMQPTDAPPPTNLSAPHRPSHLRTLSNASSSTDSAEGSAPTSLEDTSRAVESSSLDMPLHDNAGTIPCANPAQDQYLSGTPPGGGAGTEPMFNFRSLAAMVGHDEMTVSSDYKDSTDSNREIETQAGTALTK